MRQRNYKREDNNSPIVMYCVECLKEGIDDTDSIGTYVYKSSSICREHLLNYLLMNYMKKDLKRDYDSE